MSDTPRTDAVFHSSATLAAVFEHACQLERELSRVIGKFNAAVLELAQRPEAATPEPVWVVNDNGELGVKIGGRVFFLYKGDNIEYETGLHDDGSQMMYRIVGKREFGETCQPLPQFRDRWKGQYMEPLVYTPGLSYGSPKDGEWKPLPSMNNAPVPGNGREQSHAVGVPKGSSDTAPDTGAPPQHGEDSK